MQASDKDDEYGFNESDLNAGHSSLPPQAPDVEPAEGLKANDAAEPLRAEPREAQHQAEYSMEQHAGLEEKISTQTGAAKADMRKWWFIIGGCGVAVFAGLVYLAIGVMHQNSVVPAKKAPDFEARNENSKSLTTEPQINDGGHVETFRQRSDETEPAKVVDARSNEIVAVAPVRMNPEDEDAFYDNLASAAGQQPLSSVPTASAVEEPRVTSAEAQHQAASPQLNAITEELRSNTLQMNKLMDALSQVSTEVAALKTQVENDSKQSVKYGSQITALSESLSNVASKNEERFKSVTDEAIAAALKAVKMQSAKNEGASSGKMVLVGGPKIPTKPTERASVKEITITRPVVPANNQATNRTQIAAISATQAGSQQSSTSSSPQCGKTISQNWNVKGVSTTAAYIRRTDGEGIMVRAEMEVPGFGVVKSFDPNSRTVCTTSGLIVR